MPQEVFMFRNKPVVRSGDTIYYGDPADKYIVFMTILGSKKILGNDVPDSVRIQLIEIEQGDNNRRKIVKVAQKEGLYRAIDIAETWLKRALR